MAFTRTASGHFEVRYSTEDDMQPSHQQSLLAELERELRSHAVSVLFEVATPIVPKSVPVFWLEVTRSHTPRLCAMAIVSDSLAVRTAASGFSVTNRVRGVHVQVKAFPKAELEHARQWCQTVRATTIP